MKLFLSTMVLAAGGSTSLYFAGGDPRCGDPQKPSCAQASVATAPAAPSARAAHCASSTGAPAKAVSPLAAAPAQGAATAAPALLATQASAAAPAQASSCSKPTAQGAAGDVAHDPVQRALAERAALLERLASPAATAAAPQAEACQTVAAKELAQAVTARTLAEQATKRSAELATAVQAKACQGAAAQTLQPSIAARALAEQLAQRTAEVTATVQGAVQNVESVQLVDEALAKLHGRLAGVQAAKAKVTENPLERSRISGAVLADLTARLSSLHGAAAGGGVGPASGVQDPEDYEEIVRRAQEQAEREIQRAMAEAQRAIEQAQRAAERAREQAERELQRAREGAERSVQRAREQAERNLGLQRERAEVEHARARATGRSDAVRGGLREQGYASSGPAQTPRAEPRSKSARERSLEERVAELERRLGLGGGHTPMPHAVPQAPEAPHPPMAPHPPKAPKAPRAPYGLMPPHAPEAPAVPHEGKGGKLEKAKAKQGRFENVQVFEGVKVGEGDGEGWTVLKPSKFGGQGLKVFRSGDGDAHGVKVWKSDADGQDFEPFGDFDVEVEVGEQDFPHGWKVDDHGKVKGFFKLESGQHGDHGAPKGVKVWSWDGQQMRSFGGGTQVLKLGEDGEFDYKIELQHDDDDEHAEECDEEACCSEDCEEAECCEEDEDCEEGEDEGDDEDGDDDLDDEDEDEGMGVALLDKSSVGRLLRGLGVSPKVRAPVALLPSALALPRSPVAADAEQLDELRELVSDMRSEVEDLRAALRELREAVRLRTADGLR
jgi:hypothetical protein